MRKETVDIDTLVTSRDDDTKITQSLRIMSIPPLEEKEVQPVEPVQMSIYPSNNYGKDSWWLHFDNDSRVQER